MNVVIFANCYGANYQYFIEKYFSNSRVEHILSYKNLSNLSGVKDKLINADVLIVQPVKNYQEFSVDNLRSFMPKESLVIKVPFIRFNGFWQNLEKKKFRNISDNAVVFFPELSSSKYTSSYLKGSGVSNDEVAQRFESSLAEFAKLEKDGDVEFIDYFRNNYRNLPLFFDPYHPTWPFVTYVSNQIVHKIAKYFGLSVTTSELDKSYSLKGTSFFAPITDNTANCLGLDFDLDAYHELDRYSYINGVLHLENQNEPKYISSTKDLIENINIMKKINTKNIFIVTPVFNAASTLERTIESVLSQTGNFNLYYHIQDGGSKDGTIELLRDIEKKIKVNKLRSSNEGEFYFSWISERDNGMYDAIYRGIVGFQPNDEDWISWINADDTLEESCIENILKASSLSSSVNWISGRTSVVDVDGKTTRVFLPTNSYVLRNGLADGTHWNFLQQEGTFFTYRLWNKIDHQADFLDFAVAGDWNLWRSFAHFDEIYQIDVVLANFHRGEGQLSQIHRAKYLDEIESTVSQERRYACLRNHLRFEYDYNLIQDETVVERRSLSKNRTFWIEKAKQKSKIDGVIEFAKGVIAYDNQWQYPAITEEFAFIKSLELLPSTERGIVYIAFPWATLIDFLNNKKVDKAAPLLKALERIRELTKDKIKLVTVCQHILMLKFSYLFKDLGVTDIFWSHKIKQQDSLPESNSIKIHAFPLFPVQVPSIDDKAFFEKSYLYSFVGARSNPWYLTDVRQKIIDCLENEGQGLIIARDKWHYESVVYDKQVSGIESESKGRVDESASMEFQNILAESKFSLCPSGSGPNSIRLWESISTGSIPVVLADTYQPPGNINLWKMAAIFCNEDEQSVREIPDKLKSIASDVEKVDSMIAALKQLKLLYGTDSFVTDIVEIFDEYDSYHQRESSLNSIKEFFYEGKEKYPDDLFVLSIISRIITNQEESVELLKQDSAIENELISYSQKDYKYSDLLKLSLNLALDMK